MGSPVCDLLPSHEMLSLGISVHSKNFTQAAKLGLCGKRQPQGLSRNDFCAEEYGCFIPRQMP